MAEKITKKIKTARNNGVFHDTRGDVDKLAEYCNMLTDKINQLIDEVEGIREKTRRAEESK